MGLSNTLTVSCLSCGNTSTRCLGKLCANSGVINLTDPGNLYECPKCSLLFRHPYLNSSELLQSYGNLSDDLWEYSADRPDFNLTADIIHRSKYPGSVLDIGCYRGDFLLQISDKYQKYGVEISKKARQIAIQRGITLIGSSIDSIEIDKPMFDIITLMDVIEHLPNPMESLQKLVKLLSPGGMIILSTGDTSALPWYFMRCDYWYYYYEHVTFFNPKWFKWAAKKLNLNVVDIKSFSHFKGTQKEKWSQFAKSVAFWVVGQTNKKPLIKKIITSVYPFSKVQTWGGAPNTKLWKDHMLVVLKLYS